MPHIRMSPLRIFGPGHVRPLFHFISRKVSNLHTSAYLSSSFLYNNAAIQQCRRSIHLTAYSSGIVTFKLADIGEGIAEVEMLNWAKNVGDPIEEMDVVCEVQSDKAAVEITSRYTGEVVKRHAAVGDIIKIGAPLIDVMVEGETASDDTSEVPEVAEEQALKESSIRVESSYGEKKDVRASPSIRRLAKEMGIDLALLDGSGKDGRITRDDLENAAKPSVVKSPDVNQRAEGKAQVPTPAVTATRENVEVPLRGYSKAMFKSMTESLKVPHLNIGDEYDVTELIEIRKRLRAIAEKKYDLKLTITPFLVKAVSLALTEIPILNSKVDASGEKYTLYGAHNVSVAIDSSHGLVVPNIKNVQDLNIIQIQEELLRLQKLAASNSLKPADLMSGTVSISNVGVIAGTYVKAILFDGQAMIMGIGKTQTLPRYDSSGSLVPRQIMNCSFSADHRHCDGAVVARFAKLLKEILEDPSQMLLTLH